MAEHNTKLIAWSPRLDKFLRDGINGVGTTDLSKEDSSTGRRQELLPSPRRYLTNPDSYSGYFKVTDTSTSSGGTKTLKVKVVDGSNLSSSICGYAIFNGTVFSVAAEEITVTASGFLFLKSTMGVDEPPLPLAPEFEYLAAYPGVESDVGRRLIATIAIDGSKMTIAQQQHGEVQAFIWGACE